MFSQNRFVCRLLRVVLLVVLLRVPRPCAFLLAVLRFAVTVVPESTRLFLCLIRRKREFHVQHVAAAHTALSRMHCVCDEWVRWIPVRRVPGCTRNCIVVHRFS